MAFKRWKVTAALLCVVAVTTQPIPAPAQDASSDSEQATSPQPASDPDAPFLLEPETPEQFFAAVVGIVRQARPAAARIYLDKFLEMNPDDDLLLRLRKKYGTAELLKLAQIRELQPASDRLLDMVNAAFRRRASDPTVIDGLIAQYLSGTFRQSESAVRALRDGGTVALPRIIKRLAESQDAGETDRLAALIGRMESLATGPLLGLLDSGNDDLVATGATLLGALEDQSVIPFLYNAAFGPDQSDGTKAAAKLALAKLKGIRVDELTDQGVVRDLERRALALFRNDLQWQVNDDGAVEYWSWNAAEGTVELRLTSPDSASNTTGARFARQALSMSPENVRLQALFLAFVLGHDMQGAGWSVPIPTGPGTAHNLALLSGSRTTMDALRLALENEHVAAAIGALHALSQVTSRSILYSANAQRNPIVSALNYPDPSVQLAAAIAILEMDPQRNFYGSTRVVQILTRALTDSGSKTVIVVDADDIRAKRIGSFLGGSGFVPVIESTGRDGFRQASSRSDIGLIALQLNTIRWPLSQTVANLRADSRTASIPIVIYGEEGMKYRIRGLLARTPLVAFVTEAQTSDLLEMELSPFLEGLQSPSLTAADRASQRTQAAFWLAHVARNERNSLFDLDSAETALIKSSNDDSIIDPVLTALSGVATAPAQQKLQEIAVNGTRNSPIRERAAILLAFHIQRFGLQLNGQELQSVRSAWQNADEPNLATALAAVLGTLQPDNELVRDRLKTFPLPNLSDSAIQQ